MTFTSVTLSVIKDLMYTNYRSSEKEPFQFQNIYPHVKKSRKETQKRCSIVAHILSFSCYTTISWSPGHRNLLLYYNNYIHIYNIHWPKMSIHGMVSTKMDRTTTLTKTYSFKGNCFQWKDVNKNKRNVCP